MQCIPYHFLYLLGAGYLLLLALLIFIAITKSPLITTVSYRRFKNEENHLPTSRSYDIKSDNRPLDNKLKEEKYQKFKYESVTEDKVTPRRVNSIKKRVDVIHVENAERNSYNFGPTVFIPPNIMEKICEAVLNKKNNTSTESPDDDGTTSKDNNIDDKKDNLNLSELPTTKIQCDSNEYDIVPTPKSVQLRISTHLNDAEASSRDNTNPARESYYKYPLTLKMAYVNANY